jgi:colanic acid/amylovoran biosynthesis glycosyltransferase
MLCRRGLTFHVPRAWKDAVASADVIHYQWLGHYISYWSLAKACHRPCVVSIRGTQANVWPLLPDQQGSIRALRRFLPLCEAYHCVSEAIREEAVRLGAIRERTVVIRPAVDPDFFMPPITVPKAPPFRIAMTGTLGWVKGYDYALLALSRLVQSGVDAFLTVVGEGPERDRVEYMIEQLQLNDRVRLAGALSPEGVRNVLHSSHVFLLASLSEGISNVVLEAMACGLPVVTTDAGGMREVVHDGVEGLVVPKRSPEAIAEAVARLYADADLRLRLGAAGRESVVREHTIEQQAKSFVSLYERVAAAKAQA